MSKARYKELVYYCLQYKDLDQRGQALIKQLAKEAGGDLAKWLIKGVTSAAPFESLQIPCGRRQYYSRRRLFFELLNKYKK